MYRECLICSAIAAEIQPNIYKCEHGCGHIFVDFKGDEEEYHREIYRSEGQAGTRSAGEVEDDKFTALFHENRKEMCEKRKEIVLEKLSAVHPYVYPKGSLLDVGAGGGTFLRAVRPYFYPIFALEISELCYDNLVLEFNAFYGNLFDLEIRYQYDVVTCWHVLEHIKDVHKAARQLYDLTAENGTLFLEVPHSRKLKDPSTSFDGHYHYFTKYSLTMLFSGLFDIQIREGIQSPAHLLIGKKK